MVKLQARFAFENIKGLKKLKNRERMDTAAKQEQKRRVSKECVVLEDFSRCLLDVRILGHEEFAEFSTKLLSLLSGKPTYCHLTFIFITQVIFV